MPPERVSYQRCVGTLLPGSLRERNGQVQVAPVRGIDVGEGLQERPPRRHPAARYEHMGCEPRCPRVRLRRDLSKRPAPRSGCISRISSRNAVPNPQLQFAVFGLWPRRKDAASFRRWSQRRPAYAQSVGARRVVHKWVSGRDSPRADSLIVLLKTSGPSQQCNRPMFYSAQSAERCDWDPRIHA